MASLLERGEMRSTSHAGSQEIYVSSVCSLLILPVVAVTTEIQVLLWDE